MNAGLLPRMEAGGKWKQLLTRTSGLGMGGPHRTCGLGPGTSAQAPEGEVEPRLCSLGLALSCPELPFPHPFKTQRELDGSWRPTWASLRVHESPGAPESILGRDDSHLLLALTAVPPILRDCQAMKSS